MTPEPLTARLAHAETFVEVAQTALALAVPTLDAVCGAVDANGADGSPVVCVAGTYFDATTIRRYMCGGYREDPIRNAVRHSQAPVLSTDLLGPRQQRELAAAFGCLDGTARNIVVGPLTGPGDLLGTLRIASDHELPRGARELVSTVCTQVSVRLAHIGFTTAADGSAFASLTGRQRDVARLVARGYTNAEIARALSVTDNAVKKHLKLIAVALDLSNRAELAAIVSRALASCDHLDDSRLQPGFQVIRAGTPC